MNRMTLYYRRGFILAQEKVGENGLTDSIFQIEWVSRKVFRPLPTPLDLWE